MNNPIEFFVLRGFRCRQASLLSAQRAAAEALMVQWHTEEIAQSVHCSVKYLPVFIDFSTLLSLHRMSESEVRVFKLLFKC